MSPAEDRWLDRDAGPVVRPYALVGGRTRPTGETFDLVSMITAVRGKSADLADLEPEHLTLLRLCRLPASVADLAADLDLPLVVVRILLSDVRQRGLISVHHPVPTRLTDPRFLREVADRLRRLLLPGRLRVRGAGRMQSHLHRRIGRKNSMYVRYRRQLCFPQQLATPFARSAPTSSPPSSR